MYSNNKKILKERSFFNKLYSSKKKNFVYTEKIGTEKVHKTVTWAFGKMWYRDRNITRFNTRHMWYFFQECEQSSILHPVNVLKIQFIPEFGPDSKAM